MNATTVSLDWLIFTGFENIIVPLQQNSKHYTTIFFQNILAINLTYFDDKLT